MDIAKKKFAVILKTKKSRDEKLEAAWNLFEQYVSPGINLSCIVFSKKSFEAALQLKEKGNQLYLSKEFREALIVYNEAICKVPTDSPLLGQLFANRSAVYFERGLFLTCLANIDLALEHNYPPKNRHKLDERRQRCLEHVKSSPEKDLKPNPVLTPALTYPANAQHAWLSEGIQVEITNSVGHRPSIKLVAEREFSIGDIVILDKFLFPTLRTVRDAYSHCAMCFSPNFLSLIPCPNCVVAMFCSKKCMQEGQKHFHRLECPLLAEFYTKSETIALRAIVQTIKWYPDLSVLRQEIKKWRLNPGSIFEERCGDGEEQEKLMLKIIFPDWASFENDDEEKIANGAILGCFVLKRILLSDALAAYFVTMADKMLAVDIILSQIFMFTKYLTDLLPFGQGYRPLWNLFRESPLVSNLYSIPQVGYDCCGYGCIVHKVKKGDTLSFVKKYNVLDEFLKNQSPFDMYTNSLPQPMKIPRGIDIPEMEEVNRNLQRDSKVTEVQLKWFQSVMAKYDRFHPCSEVTLLHYIHNILANGVYFDSKFIEMVTMKTEGSVYDVNAINVLAH